MKQPSLLLLFWILLLPAASLAQNTNPDTFPDGKPVPAWFAEEGKVDVSALGPQYVVTRYGVKRDSTRVQTAALQRVIDLAAERGGGVIVIPKGTFLSGNLFFKPGTHLYIRKGGVLKGSDRIADFQVMETRIEGQTCRYFPALVNADGVDGFTIAGEGTIDGNGFHYWEEFWIRREWNRQCTNKDAQRPRLVYISNSSNVTVQDVRMRNSPYWTNHIYRCDHVRFLSLHITSSTSGVKGPSTDAIDIDACHDVLVRGCYMSVNDDAVVLKGGKGTWADQDPTDGPCRDIIIEDCSFYKTHGCLTLGSESVDDRNIILRRCHAEQVNNLLWLKMRPDTPQRYEYVTVSGITGTAANGIACHPWTQFYQLEDRPDMPLSVCRHITLKDIRMHCANFFQVRPSDKYAFSDFSFEDIDVEDEAKEVPFSTTVVPNTRVRNVIINGTPVR